MINKPLAELRNWTQHFSQQEIPILAHSKKRLIEMQKSLDNVNTRDIAQLVKRDPLLTLRIVRYLQSTRHSSQVTDVVTIDKVLLMIGLSSFFRSFSNAVSVEEKLASHPDALRGCLSVCSKAHLASKIAEGIAEKRNDLDPEEVTTAALLHNTAEILLWIEAPTLAMSIKTALSQNLGMRSRDAQLAILGITLHDLHLELINTWKLPRLMLHLLDERFAEEARVRTVSIATSTTRHVSNSWQDPALPDDYKNIAKLTNLTPEASYHFLQQISLKAAHDWKWFAVTPAAAGLIHV